MNTLKHNIARWPFIVFCLFVIGWLSPAYGQGEDGDEERARQAAMAAEDIHFARQVSVVVFIDINGQSAGYGSGFLVSADGYVFTNYHLMRLMLDPDNGARLRFGLVATHPESGTIVNTMEQVDGALVARPRLLTDISVDTFAEQGGVVVEQSDLIGGLEAADVALFKLALPPSLGSVPYVDAVHFASLSYETARADSGTHFVVAGVPMSAEGEPRFTVETLEMRLQNYFVGPTMPDGLTADQAANLGLPRLQHPGPVRLHFQSPPLRAGITDWALYLHGFPRAGSGFSGGPVISGRALAGIVHSHVASAVAGEQHNLVAVPAQFLQTVFGLGLTEFIGPSGYTLPESYQSKVDHGEDPFVERKADLIRAQLEKSMDGVLLAHLLGTAHELSSVSARAGQYLRELRTVYGDEHSEYHELVALFDDWVRPTAEQLVVDDYTGSEWLGLQDGEPLSLNGLTRRFVGRFKVVPRAILAYYASFLRPVVFVLPYVSIDDVADHVVHTNLMEKIFPSGFQFGIQFGEGNPVYFAGGLNRHRAVLGADGGYVGDNGLALTSRQLERVFSILFAVNERLEGDGREAALAVRGEVRSVLRQSLSLPSAAPVLLNMMPEPELVEADGFLPDLPDDLRGVVVDVSRGRRDIGVQPMQVGLMFDQGVFRAPIAGLHLTRASVHGALFDAHALLASNGTQTNVRAMLPKLELLFPK